MRQRILGEVGTGSTRAVKAPLWKYESDHGAHRFTAELKGDGYSVRQLEGGRWTASVRCERIGFEYRDHIEAIEACLRTAGMHGTMPMWEIPASVAFAREEWIFGAPKPKGPTCRHCDGTGLLPTYRTGTCPECDGTGIEPLEPGDDE